MKQPNDAKAKEEGPQIDDAALRRADDMLRAMLAAPPKPHEEMTAKAEKKRAKKPRK